MTSPKALPFIVGLGLDEVSVAPNKVEHISALIRELSYRETQALTRRVLDEALTIPELKQHLYKFLHKRKIDNLFLTSEQIAEMAS